MNSANWFPHIDFSDRKNRFRETNQLLPELFPQVSKIDPEKIQLVTTRGVLYILEAWAASNWRRKVFVSSDGWSNYYVQLDDGHLKKKKSGNGSGVRRIFDITEMTLDTAVAIVLANRYGALREEQIRVDDRELLGNYEFMIRKNDEYQVQWEEPLKLAA